MKEAYHAEPPNRIDEIPQENVRLALYDCLPTDGAVDREVLLRLAARRLGFCDLGSRVRSRLNRTIAMEKRAGRLDTDWTKVWGPQEERTGGSLELFPTGKPARPSPVQASGPDQGRVTKAILDFVQGKFFGVQKDKIPAAVSDRLGMKKIDQDTLHLLEGIIAELAEKGLLELKAGRVYPTHLSSGPSRQTR
jgi:hypothetical protein